MANFVNAVVRKVIDFVGDPQGDAQLSLVDGQSTMLMRGVGAHALLWEKGSPMLTFGGTVPYDVQLVKAGPSGSIPIADEKGGYLASAGPSSDSITDPAMRVFADRLRRGQQ